MSKTYVECWANGTIFCKFTNNVEEGKNMHPSDNIPVVLFLSEKLRNNLTTNKRPTVGVILD